MPDENNTINRRRFVKALGVTGGSAVGLRGLGQASAKETTTATTAEIDRALAADKTRTVLDEVGNPAVQRGRAEKVVVESDAQNIDAVTLPTPVGEIVYAESDGNTEAAFRFGGPITSTSVLGDVPRGLRKQLPEKYAAMPDDSQVMYLVGENGASAFRGPTETERQHIESIVGTSWKRMRAFAFEGSSGFRVFANGEDGTTTAYDLAVGTSGVGTASAENPALGDEVSDAQFEAAELETLTETDGDVGAQRSFDSCVAVCGGCVVGAAGCSRCYFACAGSLSGIGLILCGVCLAGCGYGGYKCTQCADDCANFV